MHKFNEEQEEALYFESEDLLEQHLNQLNPSTIRYYNLVNKKAQTELVENNVSSIFLMRDNEKKENFAAIALTKEPTIIQPSAKLEARQNFSLFIPQILRLFSNMGFDIVVRDRLNGSTVANFKVEGMEADNNEDEN